MLEKTIVDFIKAIIGLIGDLAKILADNQAWGVVASLFVLLVVQALLGRKDRLKMRAEEQNREEKLGELLEDRNKQILEAFSQATKVIHAVKDSGDRLSDLEDRIDGMDHRCDARQQARKQRRKGDKDES